MKTFTVRLWHFSLGLMLLLAVGSALVMSANTSSAAGIAPSITPNAVELTATVGTTPPPQTLTITNPTATAYSWSLTPLPAWVSAAPTNGTVPANGSGTITLTFALQASPQTHATTLTVNDDNAIYPAITIPITVVAAQVSKTWYFAEGTTGSGFTEYLTIANPNPDPAGNTVTIRYLLQGGSPFTKQYHLNPNSRYTLNINGEVGANKNVSMVVTGSQPITAERPMYFNFASGTWKINLPGGSDVLGATSLGTDFDFGYLDTTTNHDTYLTVLNQNSSAMDVAVSYFPAAGGAAIVDHYPVAANSRGTIHVNDAPGLTRGTYSALVHLSEPGLVERSLYLKDAITGYTGAGDVVGVTQPLTDWYFAEGFIDPTFTERYIVSNPSTTDTTKVTITFFLASGAPQMLNFILSPGQQIILPANIAPPGVSGNNSAYVHATSPVLAERFMSFKFSSTIQGATDVLGAAAPGNLFYFAEGFTGSGFSEYLTIANPDPTNTATVQVTFLPANGAAPVVRAYPVAPSSRFTLNTATVTPNQSFSMVVESNVAIVAERPMYFSFAPGKMGGSDVVGYQPPAAPPSFGLSVYVGSVQSNSVYALDASTGAVRWRFQAGSSVLSSPVVVNGVVYFGSNDEYVYALSASDGSLLWRFKTGFIVDSSPVVANEVVYIGSQDGYLYALDAATGTQIWRFFTNVDGTIESTAAVGNGVVYVADDTGEVWALNISDGSLVWQRFSSGPIEAHLLLSNGILYIPSFAQLDAFNATTGDRVFVDTQIKSLDSSPTIVNGILYAGDDFFNDVYAINPLTGAILWDTKAGGSSPAVVNGIVYSGGIDGYIYAFNAQTGGLLWKYHTDGQGHSGGAVVDGILYIGSNDGYLYALNANDGTLLWRTQTGGSIVCIPAVAP